MKRKDEDYIRSIIFDQKYESQRALAGVYDEIWRRFFHGDMWTGDDVYWRERRLLAVLERVLTKL